MYDDEYVISDGSLGRGSVGSNLTDLSKQGVLELQLEIDRERGRGADHPRKTWRSRPLGCAPCRSRGCAGVVDGGAEVVDGGVVLPVAYNASQIGSG